MAKSGSENVERPNVFCPDVERKIIRYTEIGKRVLAMGALLAFLALVLVVVKAMSMDARKEVEWAKAEKAKAAAVEQKAEGK